VNLEMANTPEILRIALRARPDEAACAGKAAGADKEVGLDAAAAISPPAANDPALTDAGSPESISGPDPRQLDAPRIGVPYVELHTGTFCNARGAAARRERQRLITGARHAHRDLGCASTPPWHQSAQLEGHSPDTPPEHTEHRHSIVAAPYWSTGRCVSRNAAAMSAYRGGDR
jgi:hypothetical protein